MSDDRTEEASAKKLRDARKKGQAPKSKELGSALVVLASAGIFGAIAPTLAATGQALFRLSLDAAAGDLASSPVDVLGASVSLATGALAPLLGALVVVAVLSSVVQTGPMFATEAISWNLERLDPVQGTKNLFTQKQLVELIKTLAKLIIVGWVAWGVLEDGLRGVMSLSGRDAFAALAASGTLIRALLLRVGGAMLAIAVLDVLYQRYAFAKEQRMTKEEVKREHKDAEGDPHAKAERDRVRQEIGRHDTIESVRSADVLVVNPTHLAVALRFDEDGDTNAPEVMAKGQDDLARRMIEVAREAGVPIMRDVPLARGLFDLEVGDEIPEDLYEAVAAVLHAAWSEREQEDAEARG